MGNLRGTDGAGVTGITRAESAIRSLALRVTITLRQMLAAATV
jgi:hypothetical protein